MRALIYDRTCVHDRGRLSPIWAMGARLYQRLGRIDQARGVASWREAIEWLVDLPEPITEIQYWGHGKWGCALIDREELGLSSLERLAPLRTRLAPDALVWFRTCETFGTRRGIELAERLADYLGARVAGHTFVIGFHQSGLHGLRPGGRADWPADEGLAAGTIDAPERAKSSRPWAPRTITCLTGEVPAAWFATP
ncbi:MAG: hypothetical protein JWO36_1560 [Myxococcales bacterium]|nr:hypothetical protein [Myxococcales bacterium]